MKGGQISSNQQVISLSGFANVAIPEGPHFLSHLQLGFMGIGILDHGMEDLYEQPKVLGHL